MREAPRFAGLIVPQPAEARSCRCSHGRIFCSLTPFWGVSRTMPPRVFRNPGTAYGPRDLTAASQTVVLEERYVTHAVNGDRSTFGVEGFRGEAVGTEAAATPWKRTRLSMGQASTDSAGCLVSRDRWSCDIGLLSQLPNLEPCEPRGRNGDELAAMVSLLRVRWGGGVDVSKARNVWRLAF